MSDDNKKGRETPPRDDEWPYLWDAAEKAHKGWSVVGPVVALLTNWKALAIASAAYGWFNQTAILEIAKMIAEKSQ
jgi:hypothetical protein|tara:strand:- start:1707 stop:1934 length:228 start_codon:yes stop_codon:yes gene_type:complete